MTTAVEHALSRQITDVKTDMKERMDKLEGIVEAIRAWQLAHPSCPAPGSCIGLVAQLDKNEIKIIEMQKRVEAIERHQDRMLGALAVIGFIIAPVLVIFGPVIRLKLGLP